jgi:hypothetical protein
MPAANRLKVMLLIIWRKLRSSRVSFIVFLAFLAFLIFFWLKDSFRTSFNFLLFFSPHLFLFLSQDMMKDEIESGMLENVIFLECPYQDYLLKKNLFVGFVALLYVSGLFVFFSGYSLATHQYSAFFLVQFLVASVVGLYYVYLGGWLSFYVRGGSNVMILIISQALIFIGLLFSATQRTGFIDYLEKRTFPNLASQLKFLAMIVILPNLAISKNFLGYTLEVIVLLILIFIFQKNKLQRLEIK